MHDTAVPMGAPLGLDGAPTRVPASVGAAPVRPVSTGDGEVR
ncbi:hypothetical protein [Pseudonocardia sp. GCM10023141]